MGGDMVSLAAKYDIAIVLDIYGDIVYTNSPQKILCLTVGRGEIFSPTPPHFPPPCPTIIL